MGSCSYYIPPLFRYRFTVDDRAPFVRHLNRLEVEIGRENYAHLKRVEQLPSVPPESFFSDFEELTDRVLKTTQNNYNRSLINELGIRVYLDPIHYEVYYRLKDRCFRFVPLWRRQVLRRFFHTVPGKTTPWCACSSIVPGFESRFVADSAGGVLLLRRTGSRQTERPLLTCTHGPYDPYTFDVLLYMLRKEGGDAAMVNLGFSGREPLTDSNLERLKAAGIPLNPSNIDVIYPYTDGKGHPYCYKLEEGFEKYVEMLDLSPPEVVIDIHGCVGTTALDRHMVVGLGGLPPYSDLSHLGRVSCQRAGTMLYPTASLKAALRWLRLLPGQAALQFCTHNHCGYNFMVGEQEPWTGREIDPRCELRSMIAGEDRTFLKDENLRWIPGATGNALQRFHARKLRRDVICLHVEMPTRLRREVALMLQQERIWDSFESSGL